ncbi:MAG: phosphate signaling complex protein PhoU [Acidiferrobacterales bacterium]|nr:phosphate signaling complex protein PhoU [Acidiferrobacterales bacterium]
MNEDVLVGGHISRQFDQELDEIRSRVLKMGGLVESQLEKTLAAIKEDDSQLVSDVPIIDEKVNKLEVQIDEECTQILAKRQPTASDLRLIIATTKSVRDIERIGDEAERVARMVSHAIENDISSRLSSELSKLGSLVKDLLHSTLNTYARMETRGAIKNIRKDARVDQGYSDLMVKLVEMMKTDPECISEALDIMWAARSLERIGDHCINICENVIYHVEGEDIRHIEIEEVKEQLA